LELKILCELIETAAGLGIKIEIKTLEGRSTADEN